jgi:hypothetical protein
MYFFFSYLIAIAVSPTDTPTICGIPSGIFRFLLIHVWFLLIFIFLFLTFKNGFTQGKAALDTHFFSIVFMILLHLPEVEWLERWIEGADLLLLMLSVFSLIENQNRFGFSISKEKEK